MPRCRLYAAPGALGGVLAYVGLNYDKLETWVTEFGTNMKDEQLLDDEAVSGQSMEPASLTMTPMLAYRHLDLGPGLESLATSLPHAAPPSVLACCSVCRLCMISTGSSSTTPTSTTPARPLSATA